MKEVTKELMLLHLKTILVSLKMFSFTNHRGTVTLKSTQIQFASKNNGKVTKEEPCAHLHLQLLIPWVTAGQAPPPLPCGLTSPRPLFFLQGHQLLDYPLLLLSVQHRVSMGSFLFPPDSLSSPIFKTALRPHTPLLFPRVMLTLH